MVNPFLHGLNMAVEHAGIGLDAKPVGSPGYIQPFLSRGLVGAEPFAHPVTEDFRTATGYSLQTGCLQLQQHFLYGQAGNLGKMGDFHPGKALQIQVRKGIMQCLQAFQIILKGPVRVQSADHMQPGKIRVLHGLLHLCHRFLHAHGVGSRCVLVLAKGAEFAL